MTDTLPPDTPENKREKKKRLPFQSKETRGRKKALVPKNRTLDFKQKKLASNIEKAQALIAKNKKALEEVRDMKALRDGKSGLVEGELNQKVLGELDKGRFADKPVAFRPHPGPQMEFLESNEDEVLFSGARGSGKSDALIVDPLRYCENKNFRALIIRKTMPELREMISRARELYPQVYPGVKWKEQEKIFTFSSGARIEFGHLESESDVERYRGQQYTWIGIDELTHIEKEDTFDRLMSSARTTDPTLKVYKRFTTNPNGPGRVWVKRRFVDLGPSSSRITIKVKTSLGDVNITRRWINSLTTDNPTIIENDPLYLANLSNLPETLRKAWLDADWNVAEGVAFPDFNAREHVIAPFQIPQNWLKFRACDWGFTSMAVCLWFAVDEDNNVYIYKEYATRLVEAPRFATTVLGLEAGDNVKYGVIDGSVGDQRGISGPTVDEQMRIANGGKAMWRYADKSAGSRIAGKSLIHKLLAKNPYTDKPSMYIFSTCKELIEELSSLPIDKNDAEDVDTKCADHAYDALRYGLMSRYNAIMNYDNWASVNPNPVPDVVNATFGY